MPGMRQMLVNGYNQLRRWWCSEQASMCMLSEVELLDTVASMRMNKVKVGKATARDTRSEL